MSDGNIRGSVLHTYIEATKSELGAAYPAVVAAMDQEIYRKLTTEVHATGFYPEAWLNALIAQIAAQHGSERVWQIGFRQQKVLIKRLHGWLAKLAGPQRLLAITASLWSQFRDRGKPQSRRLSDTSVELVVDDYPPFDAPAADASFSGSCCAMLEATGVKNVRGRYEHLAKNKTRFVWEWD